MEGENERLPGIAAHGITTGLDWADLVLDGATLEAVNVIRRWVHHAPTLLGEGGLGRRLKPGYCALFHGPAGTGKRLTACALGKDTGHDVYRVEPWRLLADETGDAIDRLFEAASRGRWILFLDEAETVFGKRDAGDRHHNQQTAYLRQRIEDYPGTVIAATQMRQAIDDAFMRRFQSTVHFPMPDADARLRLWRDHFTSPVFRLDAAVDFNQLAGTYELSGGAIANVLRFAALAAIGRSPPEVVMGDLLEGIRRETSKASPSRGTAP